MQVTTHKLNTTFLILLLLSIFVLLFAVKRWEDVVKELPDGSFELTREHQESIDDRIDRINNKAELYVLRALSNGYYFCPLCPEEATNGNGQFFLYQGEVYKYGQTINPSDRYSKTELARWNLEYIELLVSDLTTVTTAETILMGAYPLLPENLKRPIARRLTVPPGSGTNLR